MRVGLLKPPRGGGMLNSNSKREAVVFVKSTSNGTYRALSTSQSQIEDTYAGEPFRLAGILMSLVRKSHHEPAVIYFDEFGVRRSASARSLQI